MELDLYSPSSPNNPPSIVALSRLEPLGQTKSIFCFTGLVLSASINKKSGGRLGIARMRRS